MLRLPPGNVVFVQRSPRPQIVPAEAGGQANNVGLLLASRRKRFKDGIVNADVLALGIQATKYLTKLLASEPRRNFFQNGRRLRQLPPQSIDERARTPQKHAAIPVVVSGLQKFGGALGAWFLGEAPHAQSAVSSGGASFNVSVTSFGASRSNANDDNVGSRPGDSYAFLQELTIPGLISDDMIGGKHSNHRRRIAAQKNESGQADGRGGVTAYRFGDDL